MPAVLKLSIQLTMLGCDTSAHLHSSVPFSVMGSWRPVREKQAEWSSAMFSCALAAELL